VKEKRKRRERRLAGINAFKFRREGADRALRREESHLSPIHLKKKSDPFDFEARPVGKEKKEKRVTPG